MPLRRDPLFDEHRDSAPRAVSLQRLPPSFGPLVGWALVGNDEIEISGTAKIYASSEHGRRHFCGNCGTGLFYTNDAIFPGQIDVQSATLDDPDLIPAQAQIQTAERIGWMERLNDLPAFERYPPFE